jgi:hypothetical protein
MTVFLSVGTYHFRPDHYCSQQRLGVSPPFSAAKGIYDHEHGGIGSNIKGGIIILLGCAFGETLRLNFSVIYPSG